MAVKFDPTEYADINVLRNKFLYGDYFNSLIAWMCNPQWTTPKDTGPMRGEIERGCAILYNDEVSGEIDASTCHCHKSNGDSWSMRPMEPSRHNP